eukprot:scaffold273_cov349-Prasinococcus_capsulatus_cf.AAC.2
MGAVNRTVAPSHRLPLPTLRYPILIINTSPCCFHGYGGACCFARQRGKNAAKERALAMRLC